MTEHIDTTDDEATTEGVLLADGGLFDDADGMDMGGGDDLMGGADDGLMGGDMMGGGDDLMGGGGMGDDGGSDEDELTYRLDEVEKEVDDLMNKVQTVRGENENISESISSVERNVDKLVDLYEIVTQGINPFVGDQEIGNAFETATDQGGVFGDEEEGIDSDLANADADSFLDDDLLDEDDGFEEEFDTEEFEDESAFEDEEGGTEAFEDEFEDEFETDLEDDSPVDEDVDEDGLDQADTGPASEPEPTPEPEPELEGENGEAGEPPYLVRHPSRPDAELATLEWLQFLVESAGIEGAAQTLSYYESIGWLSSPVTSHLRSMLNGFGSGAQMGKRAKEPRSVLSTAEHKRSLRYIAAIATPESPGADSVEQG